MPSRTRRPPKKCRDCGRQMHLTRQALIDLIKGIGSIGRQQLEDPADLRYLVEVKGTHSTKREETLEQLLHLLHMDLMKEGGPRLAQCGVCMWTEFARDAAQQGKDSQEVRHYNIASSYRTFYNSKLYRSAVEKQRRAAA